MSARSEYREVPLSRGQVALVDECDYERVSICKWFASTSSASKTFYARGRPLGGRNVSAIHMHRLILCFPLFDVDHINGNGLDNRRANLRASKPNQNACNIPPRESKTSIYRGVYWNGYSWSASIRHERKLINLGTYDCEEEAGFAYDLASVRLHGKFGVRNFQKAFERVGRIAKELA